MCEIWGTQSNPKQPVCCMFLVLLSSLTSVNRLSAGLGPRDTSCGRLSLEVTKGKLTYSLEPFLLCHPRAAQRRALSSPSPGPAEKSFTFLP